MTHGAYVELHSTSYYEKTKFVILSEDNKTGIALAKDGNFISAFNVVKGRNSVKYLLPLAIENGAVKLDNYDGKLVDIYEQFGFTPVAKTKFNREYAPNDWNYERDGEPDIIFWVHNGDSVETVVENIGKYEPNDISKVKEFPDYESAEKYRDSLIEEKKKSLASDKNSQNEPKYSLSDSNGKKLTEAQLSDPYTMTSTTNNLGENLSVGQVLHHSESQARDEQGRLLGVYHGTGTGFTIFDRTKARSYSSVNYDLPAFYFSADKQQASDYGSSIIKAYINLTNPLIADNQLPTLKKGETPNELYYRLIEEGYDGIIIPGEEIIDNEYIVFSPSQIKLTTNLNPTDSEDIRYSLNKYTPKATASAKALIDSEIITNEINAHFWQWHSEAVSELIDKEMAKADERTVAERINSISDKIMQEGKFSKTLDEYTKEILAKNKAEYKAIAEYYKQVDLTGLHKSLIKEFGEIDGGNFILFWGNDSGTGMDINQIAMCLIQS